MTPEQALLDARQGQLKPVYLIAGEEQFLHGAVLKALREAVVRQGIPGLNEDQFTAGESDVEAAIAAARTLPMMAKRRLVLIRSLERWDAKPESGSASPLDRLADYVENPTDSTTLLLLAAKLDKRRKLFSVTRTKDWLVSCEPLPREDLPRWIERAAHERGNPLAPGVSDLLAELAGPELSSVADALERVCLYVGDGQEVTEDAVSETIVRVRPATVWELVGAVGNRDVGAALAALDRVYDPQDRGLRLLGVMAWSARQLLKFESAIRAGLSPPDAAKKAGAPPFKARELSNQIRRLTQADLERWLEVLATVDVALKGGSRRPPKAVLEHAILEMCRRDHSVGRPRVRPSA